MDPSIDILGQRVEQPDLLDRLDERIEAHAEGAFRFLERLVEAPSTLGQEQGAQEVFSTELATLGFAIEKLPIAADIGELSGSGVGPLSYEGRYDVVGRRDGDV